jgi:hypothetical protein
LHHAAARSEIFGQRLDIQVTDGAELQSLRAGRPPDLGTVSATTAPRMSATAIDRGAAS